MKQWDLLRDSRVSFRGYSFQQSLLGCTLMIPESIFSVVFCIIEMDKPSKPHNFEPQIYNMERGSRDKLILDYNTMDIWDFNEKCGDLWDFNIKKDDIYGISFLPSGLCNWL